MTDATADAGTELARIEHVMVEDNRAYWKDEPMQRRYAELLQAEENGAPSPPAPASNRMNEIERMMADTKGPYWSGPRAEQLQDEYGRLLRGVTAPAANAAHGQDFETARDVLAAKGFTGRLSDADLSHGERQRVEILSGMGATASDVVDAFNGLPDKIQALIYAEMATKDGTPIERRLARMVSRLSETDGHELKEFWANGLLDHEREAVKRRLG